MYQLHGFIAISSLANNTPGVTSPLGELSANSASFSREKGFYGIPEAPSVKLISFNSKDGETAVPVPPEYSNKTLRLSQYLFDKAVDGTLTDASEACLQLLTAEFGSELTVIRVGQMVTNGTYWLPGLVVLSNNTGENLVRLWYSDQTFAVTERYELYQHIVISPIDNLDDFHLGHAVVAPIIQNITTPYVTNKAKELTKPYPYTYLDSQNYNWVDKFNEDLYYPVPWSVAIYGEAGNNADLIRLTLVDWILANSAFAREEWEKIFPDLFLPTEYYLTPVWDRFSLPDQLMAVQMYSSSLPFDAAMGYGISTFIDNPVAHIRKHMTVVSTAYRGLNFVAVGNYRNRNENFKFSELWPQYINLPMTSLDFNRISPATQQFIRMLFDMLVAADNLGSFGGIPTGMSIIERGPNTYLASTYDDVLYLLSLKTNVITQTDEPEVPDTEVMYIATLDIGASSVIGHLYRVALNEDQLPVPEEEWVPVSPAVIVNWYVTVKDTNGEVIDLNVIADGTSEQTLLDYQPAGTDSIRATAIFEGRVVNVEHTPV